MTCSPENVPQPLVDQLTDGGLLIIPVGERYQQTLMRMRKKGDVLEKEALRPTLFVPMTGAAEDARKVQADPAHPALINGDFEETPLKTGMYRMVTINAAWSGIRIAAAHQVDTTLVSPTMNRDADNATARIRNRRSCRSQTENFGLCAHTKCHDGSSQR